MDARKYALQDWLTAEDLPDGGMDVTITNTYEHTFPPGQYSTESQTKLCIDLVEWPGRPCALSPTTTTTVLNLLGYDTNGWTNRVIRLDKSKLPNGKLMIVAGPAQGKSEEDAQKSE